MGSQHALRERESTGAEQAVAVVRDLHAEVARTTGVAIPLRLWDGIELGDAAASFRIVLHHPWSLRRLLWPPSDLSAGEAYVEGDVDVEGDMIAALGTGEAVSRLVATPLDKLRVARLLLRLPKPPPRPHTRRARLRGRRHSQARDRAAIAFHYDLPQAFYRTFLDEHLVYSCAYFLDPDESLETAQERKLDVICRKLRLQPGQRFLDIGCGWGSLLLHAARHYGVRGLGVTLSRTQAEAGRERIAAAGLADRVEIRLADYRELHGQYDAVASVGMFEHVGPDHLAEYFAAAHRLTRPGGLFCNHGIVTGDARRVNTGEGRTFVSTYVFPDGGLVPAWRAVRELQAGGFELLDVEQLRPSYARTLRHWVQRLEAAHDSAVAVAGETDYRVWRAYMAGSSAAFASGRLGLVQLLGVRAVDGRHDLPPGRSWMLPAS